MERTTEKVSVQREIEIGASPETVWEFLVDPEKAVRWWGQAISFDARPGGAYRIEVTPTHKATGEFVELDPPRRLVYTWGWAEGTPDQELVPAGSTTVEIDLIPRDGGTLLRLTHSGLPSPESAASHAEGWDHYFGRLAVVSHGGDPGPDPWASPPA
jgi:uncharacterized protein YndB with AHSA1/START domain